MMGNEKIWQESGHSCFTVLLNKLYYLGFEVFTAVVMKSTIWDMTPCSPLSFNRRFGGTYRLHPQGRRNRFSKPSKQEASLELNALHGVISQKMMLFKLYYCWASGLAVIQTGYLAYHYERVGFNPFNRPFAIAIKPETAYWFRLASMSLLYSLLINCLIRIAESW
jgi:hypothetical protein